MHARIVATGVMCLAIIASAVIYTHKSAIFAATPPPTSTAIAVAPTENLPTNSNWQKLLSESPAATSPITVVTPKNDTSDTIDTTLTGQIARNSFALYLQDQQNGVTIDDAEAGNIATQSLGALTAVSPDAKQYGVKDIHIMADSSNAAMAAFEQNIIQAIKKNSTPNSPDELTIVNTAIQSQNQADITKLDPIIKNYKGAIAALLLIPVPEKAFPDYLIYLNTLSALLSDIQSMRTIISDPMSSYIGFTNYQKDILTLKIVIDTMNTDFSK